MRNCVEKGHTSWKSETLVGIVCADMVFKLKRQSFLKKISAEESGLRPILSFLLLLGLTVSMCLTIL